jgi:hypothetical protein
MGDGTVVTGGFASLGKDEVGARNEYATQALVKGGVLRWISNGRVPPADFCAEAKVLGFDVSLARCDEDRAAETRALLESYRANPPALDVDEARAGLGQGVTVVNVLTGKRTVL